MRNFFLITMGLILVFCRGAESQTQTNDQKQTQTQAADTKIDRELEVQIWLDRNGFSPGELDGTNGKNTQKSLAAYLEAKGLPVSTQATNETLNALREEGIDPITKYTITESDTKGPFVDQIPKDYMEQAKLSSLGYTSKIEALSEKFHVSPDVLKRLNPASKFEAGEEIRVPNVAPLISSKEKVQPVGGKTPQTQSAGKTTVVVSKEKQQLVVKGPDGKTVFFAPITAGSDEYPYPFGEWKITGVSHNPPFEYNPELFKDSKPDHTKVKIPSGPNNPVGVVWIDLTAKHYGIHGTPDPGRIGYSESHGCIRLTNWDAQRVAALVRPGTAVIFE